MRTSDGPRLVAAHRACHEPGPPLPRPGLPTAGHAARRCRTQPAVTAVVDEARAAVSRSRADRRPRHGRRTASTTNVQIALLIAGVACARALTDDHGLAAEFVAGHSVGRVRRRRHRGRAHTRRGTGRRRVARSTDGSSLRRGRLGHGRGDRAAHPRRRPAGRSGSRTDDDPLWVANVNGATQTVLSGTAVGAGQGRRRGARRAGASDCERLDVAVASHCPLQAGTADRLAAAPGAACRAATPTARYLTNTRGRAATPAEAVLDDLAARRGAPRPVVRRHPADGRTRRDLRRRDPARARPDPAAAPGRTERGVDLLTGQPVCGRHRPTVVDGAAWSGLTSDRASTGPQKMRSPAAFGFLHKREHWAH